MAEAHPRCVSALLSKYGHNSRRPPQAHDLISASIVHKDPFVRDLHQVAFDGHVSHYEGSGLVSYEGFWDFLNTGIKIMTGVNNATQAAAQPKPAQDEPAKRVMGMNAVLFYTLITVLVLIVAVIVIRALNK